MAAIALAYGASVHAADWSTIHHPAKGQAQVYGSYANGCVAGAVALRSNLAGIQIMRPSRNRFYGHPQLIRFIEDLGRKMQAAGWDSILVGDLAQPRGGPMNSGHRSHQTGLDVDIWFRPGPERRLSAQERETLSATSVVKRGGASAEPGLLDRQGRCPDQECGKVPRRRPHLRSCGH